MWQYQLKHNQKYNEMYKFLGKTVHSPVRKHLSVLTLSYTCIFLGWKYPHALANETICNFHFILLAHWAKNKRKTRTFRCAPHHWQHKRKHTHTHKCKINLFISQIYNQICRFSFYNEEKRKKRMRASIYLARNDLYNGKNHQCIHK